MRIAAFFALLVSLTTCAASESKAPIRVMAAASLSDALEEIAAAWEKRSDSHVELNLGSSSALARQIQQGAPGDLFISADQANMDMLEQRRLLVPGSRRTLLRNSLAIAVPSNETATIRNGRELASPSYERIAIGDPQSVPAGIYAKQYLTAIGIWEQISDRLIPAENARAALVTLESGNADAAIVYKTDAMSSRKVRIAFEVRGADAPGISYPGALLRDSTNRSESAAFLEFLTSREAREVFAAHGFEVEHGER